MKKTVAFIGTGAMASAIIKGASAKIDPSLFLLTDKVPGKAKALADELGCTAVASNQEAVERADYVFLCVKPQMSGPALAEIAPILQRSPKVLCSILAGTSIQTIRTALGVPNYPVVRIMPNTPALIGKGQMLITCDEHVPESAQTDVLEILAACGESLWLGEQFFDQGTAISGSSPAFVYIFIEAMADAGVQIGLPRAQAISMAARAVYGAAAMVLETDAHPGALKDMVTSPGGSTIAGVLALEAEGLRNAVIQATLASYERNVQMGQLSGASS